MTQELQAKKLEVNPQVVADEQVGLSEKWAALYADSSQEKGNSSAEIILRNPAIYLRDIDPSSLPADLQDRWNNLLSFSDTAVTFIAEGSPVWGAGTTGLEKIHDLVRDGIVNPLGRGTVSDIMRTSSILFAESTQYLPGNTQYYAGNVMGAASWLKQD